MTQTICINLPVSDLDASRTFFSALGYRVNERFSDGNALCLVISDRIAAMLLRRDFFAGFTPRPVADGHRTTEAIIQDLGRKPGRSGPGGSPSGVQCCLSTSDYQAVDSHCLQHQHETAAGLAVAARGPDVSPGVTPADWDEARTSLGLLRELSGIPVVHGREDVNCLSADSRQAVDTLVDLAVAAGWSEPWPPTRRGRQMYGRADADLDGHLWEILWMDPQAAEI